MLKVTNFEVGISPFASTVQPLAHEVPHPRGISNSDLKITKYMQTHEDAVTYANSEWHSTLGNNVAVLRSYITEVENTLDSIPGLSIAVSCGGVSRDDAQLPFEMQLDHRNIADGALRETWEEANARVEVTSPYAHIDIPIIGQTYILFRAHLLPPYTFSSGSESLEVKLFEPSEIPFDKLAFSSIAITLQHWVEDCREGVRRVHHGVINKKPGVKAWDLSAFEYVDNYALHTVDKNESQQDA